MKTQKIKHEYEIGDNLGCLIFIAIIFVFVIIMKSI